MSLLRIHAPPGARPRYLAPARVALEQRGQLIPLLRLIAVDRGAGNFELSSNQPAFGR